MMQLSHSPLNWRVFLLATANINAWINNILACNSRPRAAAMGSSLGKLEGTLIYCARMRRRPRRGGWSCPDLGETEKIYLSFVSGGPFSSRPIRGLCVMIMTNKRHQGRDTRDPLGLGLSSLWQEKIISFWAEQGCHWSRTAQFYIRLYLR